MRPSVSGTSRSVGKTRLRSQLLGFVAFLLDQVNSFEAPWISRVGLWTLRAHANLEYTFVISKDVDARKHHGKLGTSMIESALRNFWWARLLAWLQHCQGVPCHLFPFLGISVEMASVDTGGHHSTEAWRQPTRPGVFLRGDVTHHCGVKDMSVRRSTVGIQALGVSVASVVLGRSIFVAGAGRLARCDAATGASLSLRPNLSAPSRIDSLCGAAYRSGEVFTSESLYKISRRTNGKTGCL